MKLNPNIYVSCKSNDVSYIIDLNDPEKPLLRCQELSNLFLKKILAEKCFDEIVEELLNEFEVDDESKLKSDLRSFIELLRNNNILAS
jgi:hypothetical protein